MVVTLGALIAEVSHTLPVPITGLASSEELVEELELERSNYEGPTGIVGVVHDLCRQAGIDSASLWAAVPHYVAAVPNPKAALALLRRLEGLTGIAVEASDAGGGNDRLRGADRPRRRRQPGDRGAGLADRGRTGRPAQRRGRGAALRRHPRPRVPALPPPARRQELAAPLTARLRLPQDSAGAADHGGSRTRRRRSGGARLEVLARCHSPTRRSDRARPDRRRRVRSAPPPRRRRATYAISCRGRPRPPRPRGARQPVAWSSCRVSSQASAAGQIRR